MGRKIEKRPHDGGGSVTCSIMAWFPLFSLTHTTHWWPRTGRYGIVSKLEPFFCPSKLSDVREGLGFGRGNEVISGRFQIVSLLYSCNRCKIDPTMHKRRHYSTRISNLTLKAEFSKIFVSNFVTHCWKKNLTHEFYSILTSKTKNSSNDNFYHFDKAKPMQFHEFFRVFQDFFDTKISAPKNINNNKNWEFFFPDASFLGQFK